MDNIKLTVIIPVYNQEELISRALYSVPNREDIEVIVVNDGSVDKTEEKVKEWLVDESIKNQKVFINRKENKGVSATVNEGLEKAKGEYTVLLGSDDYLIEDFNKVIEQATGEDLVYFDLEINCGDIWRVTPATKSSLCGSVKLMRTKFIEGLRNDEGMKYGEDFYFYQKLLSRNPVEKFTAIVGKHYNFPREGSLSWQQRNGK